MDHHSKSAPKMRLCTKAGHVQLAAYQMMSELSPIIGEKNARALLNGERVDVEVDDAGKAVIDRLMPSIQRHVRSAGKRRLY